MPIRPDDLAAVERVPLFAKLGPRTSTRLFRAAQVHHFGAGSLLFREGDRADHLYAALDGYVCLKASDGRGEDPVIEFVSPGHAFITAAVMLERAFLLTAQVVQPGRVLMIPAEDFRRCAETDLVLARELIRASSAHWRSMIGQIKSLKMQTGPQRLAAFLVSLAEGQSGQVTVQLPCERRLLATWLGMVPASASRAFNTLQELGVEGRGAQMTIRSVERLREYTRQSSPAARLAAVRDDGESDPPRAPIRVSPPALCPD